MKNQKELYFIRFGNLNPVKHKEHRYKADYHVAPRVKGFYAFPRGYFWDFLITGEYTNGWNKFFLDDNGQRILYEDFYEEWDVIKPEYRKIMKKQHIPRKAVCRQLVGDDYYMTYKKPPKKFYYNGPVWSHLEDYCDNESIMARHGSWVKTSYAAYLKALHKCDIDHRFAEYMGIPNNVAVTEHHGNPHTFPLSTQTEYYEVFIEHL